MRKSVLIQAGRRHLDLERVDLIDICHEDDDLLLAGGVKESRSCPLTENHGSSSPRRGTEEKEPFSCRNMNVIDEGFLQGNNVKNGQAALARSKSFQQSELASVPSGLPDTVEDVAVQKKVKGRTNLRKSLAWNKAFFTDEGVLDVDELQIMSKTPKKPVQLPVIEIPDLPKAPRRVTSREAADPLHSSGSVVLAAEASAPATGKLDLATEATAAVPGKLISTAVAVESSEKMEVDHSTNPLNSSLRDVMPEGPKVPPRSTATRSATSSIGGGKPTSSSLQGNSSKLLAVADVVSKTKPALSLKHEAASRGKLEAAPKAKLDTSLKIKSEAASKFPYNLRSKSNLQAKTGDSSKQVTAQKSSSGSSAVAKQDIAVSSSSASIPKAKPSGLRMPAPKLGFFESGRTNPTSSLPDKSGVAGSNTCGGPVTGRTLPPRVPDVSARTKPPTGRTAQTMDPLAAAVHASVQSGIPSAPHLRVSAYNLRSRAASASAPASPHKGRASAGSAPASPQRSNPRMFSSGAEQSRQGTPATSPAKMESRHGARVKVQNHDSPARKLNSGAGQLEYAVAGSSRSTFKDSLKGSSVRSPPGLQSRPGTGLYSALHAVPEHGGQHVIPRAQAEPARSISGVVVSQLMKYSGSSASPPPPSSVPGPRLVRCTSSPMVLNRNSVPSTVPGKSPLANATPKKESRSFFSLARKAVSRLTSSSSSPKEAGLDKENGNVQSPAASKKTRRFFESARTTEISTPPGKSGLASSKGGSVPLAGRAFPPKVPDSNGQSKLPSPPVVRAAQSMDPLAAAVHAGVQSNIPSAPHLRGSDNTSRSRIPSASAPTSPQRNDSRFLSSGAEQSFEGPSLAIPSKPEYRYGSFAQGLAGRLKSGTRQPGSPGSAAASSPTSLSTNSAHQGSIAGTDSSSSPGLSGALHSVSEDQPQEVDPEVPAALSPVISLQAGAKPLGTPDHMVLSPLQPTAVNDAEPGGHLMLSNTGSSAAVPAGGNTPISLTKLAGLAERRNSISLGVSAATFCGDREGCKTGTEVSGLNSLTRCEETSGADDRNSGLQGAGTVVHGRPSEPKEAVGMRRLSNGGESVSSPSHWIDWHKFQERTPNSKTLIPKPGGAKSVSPVLVAQLMQNSQSGSSPTSSSSGDGPRLVRCTSSPMVMNGRSPLANAAPKRRESRSFFSLARKAVSKLTSSPSSSGKAGQETEKADGQPLPASQLGRRLSKSGQGLQNRRDSTDRADDDSQNENDSAQSGVLQEVKKLPPFTEEWIAALEAAGQEALEMKGGSVQNSPPNKISPKSNPWSPVRRNGLGPFDCTKRCS